MFKKGYASDKLGKLEAALLANVKTAAKLRQPKPIAKPKQPFVKSPRPTPRSGSSSAAAEAEWLSNALTELEQESNSPGSPGAAARGAPNPRGLEELERNAAEAALETEIGSLRKQLSEAAARHAHQRVQLTVLEQQLTDGSARLADCAAKHARQLQEKEAALQEALSGAVAARTESKRELTAQKVALQEVQREQSSTGQDAASRMSELEEMVSHLEAQIVVLKGEASAAAQQHSHSLENVRAVNAQKEGRALELSRTCASEKQLNKLLTEKLALVERDREKEVAGSAHELQQQRVAAIAALEQHREQAGAAETTLLDKIADLERRAQESAAQHEQQLHMSQSSAAATEEQMRAEAAAACSSLEAKIAQLVCAAKLTEANHAHALGVSFEYCCCCQLV